MYKCICGREFKNLQSIRGHKRHCVEYQLITYGKEHYEKNCAIQLESSRLAREAVREKAQKNR